MVVRAGVHGSIAGSLANAVGRAQERGCDCFQIFTRNPRGWAAKEITGPDATKFIEAVRSSGLSPVFAHMPYLPNLASEKPEIYQKSVDTLAEELTRCHFLKIPYLVTHLGHASDSPHSGRKRVIDAINTAMSRFEGDVVLLLENTAGERNSVGSSLGDIGDVMAGLDFAGSVGLCFDTCHACAAGYDLRNPEAVDQVIGQIDTEIGLSRLRLIHLNDAKGQIGSGLDRHEHLGLGTLGETGIRSILTHPSVNQVPFICETPVDVRRDDAGTIRIVREYAKKL